MAIRQRLGGILKPYTVSGPGLPEQAIALKIAEALREIATRQGNVPFRTGELRDAHESQPYGSDGAVLAVNTPYARALHDGRPAITIRAKPGKRLFFWVNGHGQRKNSKRVKPLPRDEALKQAIKDGEIAVATKVHQRARAGNPWLRRAIEQLQADGLDWLAPQIGEAAAEMLTAALRGELAGGALGPNVERAVAMSIRVLKETQS
ncbi:MAG: hypothetical protein H6931_17625 [Burkholderiaceae bacterium]|nr:hypothetical protein [Zoogloeaceae bacterium]MCP5290911.1 hypothetical protein [Burkholderiaceae bacterium]